jgi:hypothetical protein
VTVEHKLAELAVLACIAHVRVGFTSHVTGTLQGTDLPLGLCMGKAK